MACSAGRRGEGENHKKQKLWVKDNPAKSEERLDGARAETEEELLSGDRIDVVIYGENAAVAVEVKNSADLERGIYLRIVRQIQSRPLRSASRQGSRSR